MKRLTFFSFAVAVAFALSSVSMADVIDNSGAGGALPDNDPAGVSSTITIGANETISDVDVSIFGFNHTWVGDLTVTLTGPDGATTADIMFRTGDPEGDNFGDSSDVGGDYTFSDGEASWWDAAAAAGATDVIAPGLYEASTSMDGSAVSLAGLFGGMSTAGDWTLTISDNAAGDTGDFTGWGVAITSTAIPEPTGLGVLALVGLVGLVRRKK